MNADALSDLVLLLVCAGIAWRSKSARPAVAVASALIGAAAMLGVLRYSGVPLVWGPHRFASLLAACAAFLLLQGRRLGPPLVTTAERPRREAAEHVRAMAAMARRAQLSRDLADHQRTRLKRGLARRRAVSADLPDAEFAEQLRRATPALAPELLAQVETVLAGLRPEIDEQRLVTLAAQIDEILRQEGVRTFGA